MRSKQAVLNVASSIILQVVALVCGFIIPRLIITNFGSNVNGLITSITQFLAYVTLLEAGIGPVVKAALYKPIAKKDKKEIINILKAAEKFFRIIALIFIVYLLVLAIVYPVIVKTEFRYIYTLSLIIIIAISTFAEYYFGMTYSLYLQADQKTYVSSIVQTIVYILNVIAIVVLIKFGAQIHIVKIVSGIIFIIRPIAQNIYVKKKYNIDLTTGDEEYKLEKKWDGLAQHIAYVIHSNTDIAILTFFTKIAEVSVYSIYTLVVRGIKAIVQAFTGGIDASFGDMLAKGEHEQLNKNFRVYELIYFTVCAIVYSCTIILITPFVKVYTTGITDANYIRPLFGTIIVLSECMWNIRLPYSTLTLAAGHFKQTRKGAWIECMVNIGVSLALVWNFGIVGVAIGTLVAMSIRTAEFVYHTSKYILKRNILVSIKKIVVIAIEILLIVALTSIIPSVQVVSYFTWILQALITGIISVGVVTTINIIVFNEEVRDLFKIIKRIIKRK